MPSNGLHSSVKTGETPVPGLAGWVARFAVFIKSRGFRVFQSGILDTLRSLEQINLSSREDFFSALRANLVTNDMEWAQFLDLFEEFFRENDQEDEKSKDDSDSPGNSDDASETDPKYQTESKAEQACEMVDQDQKEFFDGVSYSPVSILERKDLSRFCREDIQVAQLTLKKMLEPFKIQTSRRSKRSRKRGDMDFPKIMRKSLKNGGVPLELFYKEKRRRLKRLVILADVSGSMDRYARFVMPFILGLKGIGSRAEVFVFSTSLTPITTTLRHLSLEKALERISEEVPDWSGGTRIGYSFQQFNQHHGITLLNRRTVLVILSDGWDLGGKKLLEREMENLSRKAHTVIWLNPLAGDPDYEPICQGMKVALPYVDYLLPVASLQNLRKVGKLLSKVMLH